MIEPRRTTPRTTGHHPLLSRLPGRWAPAALGIILLLSSAVAIAEEGRETSARVLRPGDPLEHGVKESDLAALRGLMKKAVDDGTLPGVSLLLAHEGEVIFKEAYGNLAVDQPARIASSTKPVAASAVLTVVD